MADTYALSDLRLMRLPEVLSVCGISRSLLYKMMSQGTFPQKVRINSRAVGWRECDIKLWLASRSMASTTEWR